MRAFYNATVTVRRLKASGNIRSLQATATAEASIQPLGKETAAIQDGIFGKTYQAYVDADVPVQKGDYITDQDGLVYVVSDLAVRDYGAFPVKELVLKRTQSPT